MPITEARQDALLHLDAEMLAWERLYEDLAADTFRDPEDVETERAVDLDALADMIRDVACVDTATEAEALTSHVTWSNVTVSTRRSIERLIDALAWYGQAA